MEKIDFAVDKVQVMKERFAITNPPSLDIIRHPHHLAVAAKAARAGTVLSQNEPSLVPLVIDESRQTAFIEFASHLDAEQLERRTQTGLASLLHEELPNMVSIALDPRTPSEESLAHARKLVSSADVVIIATRNAHLIPRQRELAQEFLCSGQKSVLLCLRNPYDGGVLTGAESVLFTCGDSAPSLAAAVKTLVGNFSPTARLPVSLTME